MKIVSTAELSEWDAIKYIQAYNNNKTGWNSQVGHREGL